MGLLNRSLAAWLLLLVLPILVLLPAPSVLADDTSADTELTEEEQEERLEAVDRHTERAWRALRTGNHDEVLARMQRLERYDPQSALAPYLRARVAARVGDYDQALADVTKGLEQSPDDRRLEALRFDLLLDLGRAEEVEKEAAAILAKRELDVAAHAARGLAFEHLGEREKALESYDAVLAAYNKGTSPAEDLPWVARAAIRVTRVSPNPGDDLLPAALKLLARWIDDHPEDQDVRLQYADLFQADRGPKGQSKAAKYYKLLLDDNPELAHARVGLARTLLVFWQQDRAIRELERALVTNKNMVPALSLLASIHIGNGDYERADELLARARKINPTDKEARAVEAAGRWIRGEMDAYRALEAETLAQDAKDGRFYVIVSELVGERQRRYDVAATLAEKAIQTDGDDPLGYTVLGEALMNLGKTKAARKTFRKAVTKSKRYTDVKRDNWLEALRVLDDFKATNTERFIVRFHPSEYEVMKLYLPDLMEESWKVLTEKYGYTPVGPVYVDSFHRADDFSVRSVGVRGLPALGVCFGEVITVLGPTSRPLGSFSWARTAWHEFAHTITLGLSKGQVPRWLTEGLSVYEEKARRPHWGREMERELYNRYRNDRLLRMSKINRAFRGPDIMFAYFQGGLIAEHLAETKGFEVIPKMLQEFGKDRTTAQVFKDVLGLELADYDRQLMEYVGTLVGDYKMVPIWDAESLKAFQERVAKDPKDAEAWARIGWAQLQRGRAIDAGQALHEARKWAPDDLEVVHLEGRLAEQSKRLDLATQAYEKFLGLGGDDVGVRLFLAKRLLEGGGSSAKAVAHLEAAKACFPTLIGKMSPYLALAKLYEGTGLTEKAIEEYEAYANVAGEDYGVRKKLKTYYLQKKDYEKVARLSEEMIEISPFGANPRKPPDITLHRDAATAYEALGRPKEALRELRAQVEIVGLVEEEKRIQAGAVEDHLRLGRRHLVDGRPLDALTQAHAALRLSPEHADALMLKAEAAEAAGYR